MQKIKQLKVGETPTFMEASFANPVIDGVNAFTQLQFVPDGIAELKIAGDNSKLIFNTITTLGIESGAVTTFRVVAVRDVPEP